MYTHAADQAQRLRVSVAQGQEVSTAEEDPGDAIFEEVHRVNQAADQDEGVLRISLDTKAMVKVGPFSRGGYGRQGESACDQDFQPETTLTPFGIPLPETGNNHLRFGQSMVTADFMVDRLE